GEFQAEVFPAGRQARDVGVADGGDGLVVGRRGVAQEGDFRGQGAGPLGVGQQALVVEFVQPQVGDGLLVALGLGLVEAVENCGGDGVLDAVDVQVVEVFAGPYVAVGGVAGLLKYL